MQKFETIKQQVEFVLKEYRDTRNSDYLLVITVFDIFLDNDGELSEENLKYINNITRARRYITNKGKYLPTSWIVAKKRRIAEKIWREYMRKSKFKIN